MRIVSLDGESTVLVLGVSALVVGIGAYDWRAGAIALGAICLAAIVLGRMARP
jgi:uncharacterized membrane-anchored protein